MISMAYGRVGHSDGASHGADSPKERERPDARRKVPYAGDAAGRGLERTDACEVRGYTHGAPAVAAQAGRGHAGCEGRGFSPARSTGRSVEVPGIARSAVKQVRSLIGHQELGAIGGAQDERTRRSQARDNNGVFAGDVAAVQKAADFAEITRRRDRRLDRDWKTVKRATRRRGFVHDPGLRTDAFGVEVDERVELRVEALDLADVGFGKFGDGDFARTQQLQVPHRGEENDVSHDRTAT